MCVSHPYKGCFIYYLSMYILSHPSQAQPGLTRTRYRKSTAALQYTVHPALARRKEITCRVLSIVRPSCIISSCTIGKVHSDYGEGLELCPLCRFEGELIDTNERRAISSHPDRKKKKLGIGIYSLMHLDTNTRSAKRGPSPATTMMLILMRASVNGACLHRISVLVSGRRCPPTASLSLRLFSLRNSRPQRSISFFVIGRGNETGWRARRRSWLWLMMATCFANGDRDGLRCREQWHG
jgi:hypothetical protein